MRDIKRDINELYQIVSDDLKPNTMAHIALDALMDYYWELLHDPRADVQDEQGQQQSPVLVEEGSEAESSAGTIKVQQEIRCLSLPHLRLLAYR